MHDDPWLERWLPHVQKSAQDGCILELGCGSGLDTADLATTGCPVIATDLSSKRLKECAQAAPQAHLLQMDIGNPFPLADQCASVVVASLCLHFFSWDTTLQIASEILRCMKPGGLLLARFNSTLDFRLDAPPDREIEPGFFQVGKRTKRFFDEPSVRMFLQPWDIQHLDVTITQRYKSPKYIWEAIAKQKQP